MRSLNKNIKNLYIIIIFFLFIKFLSFLNIIPSISNLYTIIWFIIFIVGLFITYEDYNHFFNVKDKIDIIIIVLFIYLISYFSLGLLFGYSFNVYNNTNIKFIFINLYLYILPIFFQEYIRGVLCNYSNNSSKIKFFISVIYILTNINFISFNTGESILRFLCSILIPLISLEFTLTYLCSVGGFKLSTIYKLFINLFFIFMPIVPNLNYFFNGIIYTAVPILVYFIMERRVNKEINRVYIKNSNNRLVGYIPILLVVVFGVMNLFGILKYQTISILSNSMNPLYSRGDMVFIKNLNYEEKLSLKLNDIIAFYDKNGNLIVHRIVKIIDGEDILFVTKGDNNEFNDSEILKIEDIKGKYLFHIKYLGFPTVFIYEILNN